jgi:hypothetical protein
VVSIISQFAAKPTEGHLQAAKRVLQYIKGMTGYKLHLGMGNNDGQEPNSHKLSNGNQKPRLHSYSNTNWGRDPEEGLLSLEPNFSAPELSHTSALLHLLAAKRVVPTVIYPVRPCGSMGDVPCAFSRSTKW